MDNNSSSYAKDQILDSFSGKIYAESLSFFENAAYFIIRTAKGKRLAILMPPEQIQRSLFQGEAEDFDKKNTLLLCPTDIANSQAIRKVFPSLTPTQLGLETSLGAGDRLGLATPGHVRALRAVLSKSDGRKISPIFAQQSMRENSRTNRTPQQVVSDATWGAFQAGWFGSVGADADHLKKESDIDICAEAKYTLFTIDPGEYVDSSADTTQGSELLQKVEALPWHELETTLSDLQQNYLGKQIELDDQHVIITQEDLMRAAAKYGRAVAHVTRMYRHLLSKNIPFELEVSVDETDTPTSFQEHYYVANELKRLGVYWVSLAPRFVGRFEKGVDYIGDLRALEKNLNGHACIARSLGPYKLSLHSGSDKFSVYPLANIACQGLVHLKTAGTSYLEALRVISSTDVALFREILSLARQRYENDRKTYHVSASLEKVPLSEEISDQELPGLLDQFDSREVLHVTFGSVLDTYGVSLLASLEENEELYYQMLERHFIRHLEPFVSNS